MIVLEEDIQAFLLMEFLFLWLITRDDIQCCGRFIPKACQLCTVRTSFHPLLIIAVPSLE